MIFITDFLVEKNVNTIKGSFKNDVTEGRGWGVLQIINKPWQWGKGHVHQKLGFHAKKYKFLNYINRHGAEFLTLKVICLTCTVRLQKGNFFLILKMPVFVFRLSLLTQSG